MVVFTVAAVGTIITGGGAAVAGAAVGSSAGATAAGVGTGAAVGTAVGVGVSGGAIAGAAASSSVTGAVAGAVAGGSAGAGVGGSGIGLGALAAGTGGWGLLVVGTSVSEENHTTYDCWKPVVHDTSMEPSNGMLLKDMVYHPHVSKVTLSPGILPELPNIVVENIWNEMFEIEYFWLRDTSRIVCHAKPDVQAFKRSKKLMQNNI